MDIHIWAATPVPAEWYADVTVTHPWAIRNRHDLTAGRAAAKSEAAKRERYGDGSGGVYVTPAAVESFGRLGVSFQNLLWQLEARWATVRRKTAGEAASTRRRWCAELGVAMIRAQALSVKLADRPPRPVPTLA